MNGKFLEKCRSIAEELEPMVSESDNKYAFIFCAIDTSNEETDNYLNAINGQGINLVRIIANLAEEHQELFALGMMAVLKKDDK